MEKGKVKSGLVAPDSYVSSKHDTLYINNLYYWGETAEYCPLGTPVRFL